MKRFFFSKVIFLSLFFIPYMVYSSQLDFVISPEIKNDPFYFLIKELASDPKIKTVLEIGSSSGEGSTEAFVLGLKMNPSNPQLYCMELSKPRFEALKKHFDILHFLKKVDSYCIQLKVN